MRVIYDKVVICPNCHDTLVYEDSDVYTSIAQKARCVECPTCCKEIPVGECVPVVQYPQDFDDYSGGVDVPKTVIQKWINEALEYFRANPEEYGWYAQTGNTAVFVFNGTEEIEVFVTKDYKSASMDLEILKQN